MQSILETSLDTHLNVDDLGSGQHLLLWAFRATAMGHADCPTLRKAFHAACCGLEDEALMGLLVIVRTLGYCGRRKMKLHVPGCRCVSADECAILSLFAAAKNSVERGDETTVRAELGELVDPSLSEGLLLALQTVTSALETNSHAAIMARTEYSSGKRMIH